MTLFQHHPKQRPGRPAVRKMGLSQRPYDPRTGTPKRRAIIQAIHRHREALDRGVLTHSDLAAEIGCSLSYMSITKNSHWGQQYLRFLADKERTDNDPE